MDTYAAYGATEILYKECAKQAEYTIERGLVGEDGEEAEVETLENGTQIGRGSGWWYEGMHYIVPHFQTLVWEVSRMELTVVLHRTRSPTYIHDLVSCDNATHVPHLRSLALSPDCRDHTNMAATLYRSFLY